MDIYKISIFFMKDIIKRLLRENLDKKITCEKCGWSWKRSESGPDMYFCHKCEHDNTPDNIEETEQKRISFKLSLPNDILQIKDVFKKNGYKLYVVGGAVRDALLGKAPKDFDLATDAVPDKVEEILTDAGFRTLPTGKAFGVINVFTDSGEYEIATFRSEIGAGRRPDAVKFTDIETDVKRRDLTINALFYDIDSQEVVDLVGGIDDLNKGVVKTVGSPEERFCEDRLRILRAIRFAGRFGSNLADEVDKALSNDSSLEGISGERIRDEFIKGITSSKSTKHFLGMIKKYDLFDCIFGGLNINQDFTSSNDPIIVISFLLKDNESSFISKRLNDLKYTVDEIRNIVFLVNLQKLTPETAVTLKRAQKSTTLTNEQIIYFGQILGLNDKLLKAFISFGLTVSGDDLMKQLNLKPGKDLGNAINQAEYKNFLKLIG
jgi:tRNA nucleotidyltransferase/poly(A) polymerase